MEDSQEKDYSFLGNDTFPNLYDALVYERKFKSEYLERQIYERLLKSESSIVKCIENQSERFSKLTLYHLKKRATMRSRPAREPSRIHYILQSRVPLGPGKFHVVVLVNYITSTITPELHDKTCY